MDYFDSRDYLTEEPLPREESDISHFYDDTNIFITGSTGFIGSLILEKLLRCCIGIKKVYLLLRIKNGKTEEKRFHDLFKNDIFYKLWKTYPDFRDKVKLIPGDCSQPNLGISSTDRETLLDVNVIFHVAAELRFDEHLRHSFQTNVCATRDLLELAKRMKNLKGFTYISTAFSHITEPNLKEEFYKPVYSYNEIKTIVDNCSDEEISQLMPLILGNATTYSFTKSVTEGLIEESYNDIPIGIVRPSIVVNTCEDPLSGWLTGLNGHSGVLLGILLGFLHVLKVPGSTAVDFVPGDKVVSAAIAGTWDYITNKPQNPIYNVVSTRKCGALSWLDFKIIIKKSAKERDLATKFSVWEPSVLFIPYATLYKILVILLHLIPGICIDILPQIAKRKISVLRLYRKAAYLWNVMDVYVSKNWHFQDDNLYRLWDNMNVNDKRIFNFSMMDFQWGNFMCNCLPGLQVYILKEIHDFESIKRARKKRDILKLIHYAITTILIISMISVILYFTRK